MGYLYLRERRINLNGKSGLSDCSDQIIFSLEVIYFEGARFQVVFIDRNTTYSTADNCLGAKTLICQDIVGNCHHQKY